MMPIVNWNASDHRNEELFSWQRVIIVNSTFSPNYGHPFNVPTLKIKIFPTFGITPPVGNFVYEAGRFSNLCFAGVVVRSV